MKNRVVILLAIATILLLACCSKKPVEQVQESVDGHSHKLVTEEQTVEHEAMGYCGNTQTTIYDGDKTYTFEGGNSVTLTDILLHLDYDPDKLCKCLPSITVDTEFQTGYGLSLGEDEGYARCEKGQAELTLEQVEKIKEIIENVKNGEVF